MSKYEFGEHVLKVVESSGGPRSGKGTITKRLGQIYPGAETDETGKDYRALTLGFLDDGRLEVGMPQSFVNGVLLGVDKAEITDMVARRYEIIATRGEDILESPEVTGLVGMVSPLPHVREAVKEGFSLRVEHQIDKGTRLLIVDGRNLKPILEKIKRTKIVLRLFVDCEVPVAVLREAKRFGVDLSDPNNQEWYDNKYAEILNRRRIDESRGEDPAIPDSNALKYWFNGDVRIATAKHLASQNPGMTESQAMHILCQPENMRKDGRYNAGTIARQTDRQIYFDTSEIGLEDMITYARRMVDEALLEDIAISLQ